MGLDPKYLREPEIADMWWPVVEAATAPFDPVAALRDMQARVKYQQALRSLRSQRITGRTAHAVYFDAPVSVAPHPPEPATATDPADQAAGGTGEARGDRGDPRGARARALSLLGKVPVAGRLFRVGP